MYLATILTKKTLIFGISLTFLLNALFPTPDYYIAMMVWLVALVIDILTKYYALANQNKNNDVENENLNLFLKVARFVMTKGLFNAMYHGKINSQTLWRKTAKKLWEFIILFILMACAYWLAPFKEGVLFIIKTVFFVAFLREVQSIFENFRDAGHDVKWILKKVKEIENQVDKDEAE
jgi:phage-related holin